MLSRKLAYITSFYRRATALSLSMKISEYILHINSPPLSWTLCRRSVCCSVGVNCLQLRSKNPAVCAQHVSVRRFIMAPPPTTELRVMMKSQKSETLRQVYSHLISGPFQVLFNALYPMIIPKLRCSSSPTRVRSTLSCRAKKKRFTEDLFH